MPMGMGRCRQPVLFSRFLKFDSTDPAWPDRDRFVLSAGHGSMLLYALLYLTGYEDVTSDELKAFRQWGSMTPGHPEYGHTPGVETTRVRWGRASPRRVGMALAERLLNARIRRRFRRSLYLRDRRRRLPDGGSQPRSDFAGRASAGSTG